MFLQLLYLYVICDKLEGRQSKADTHTHKQTQAVGRSEAHLSLSRIGNAPFNFTAPYQSSYKTLYVRNSQSYFKDQLY